MKEEPPISERWNNKAIFSLLWPLMIEQMLMVAMGAADTVMVSHVGEFAVSGVNIVDNISNLLIIAFTALSTGGGIVVSQYMGRRDTANSRVAAKQLVYTALAVSLLVSLTAVIFRRPLITLLYGRIEDDVMGAAAIYFLLAGLSYPFLSMHTAGSALFRATGNSFVPMRISIFVNILKVGLNVFLIYFLKLGVFGAGLSTLISRMTGALLSLSLLYRNQESPVSLAGLLNVRLAVPMIRNICNIGIPSALEGSMFMVGRILTQRLFVLFGTAAMAANAVASVINSFSFVPGIAFGATLTIVVGQCIGAGDYALAKKQASKILKLAFFFIFTISVLTYIFMDALIGIFGLSPEAHEFARAYLRVHCISMAFGWVMSFAMPNALRAAGDARYVMYVAVLSMWIARVSAAYLFVYVFEIGPIGVWIAMGTDFAIRGIFYYTRWRGGKWQNKKVITG
ncbi:MAG: MATE family efflux transporter [Treponema sp.]|nr:MATE family efflux transporter [Treponema sp.]